MLEEREGKWGPGVGDFCFTLGLLGGVACAAFAIPLAAYVEGLRMWGSAATLAFAVLLPAVSFIFLSLRVVAKWRRSGFAARLARLAPLAVAVLLFVPFSQRSIFTSVRNKIFDMAIEDRAFLYASRTWVRSWADIVAIRAWAKANPGWCEKTGSFEPLQTRRPACISALNPYRVVVSHDGSRVTLDWKRPCSVLGPESMLVLRVGPEDEPSPTSALTLVVTRGVTLELADWDLRAK
jgi:hypothetical protein